MKSMGDIISQQRKENSMTQAELAAMMNVTDKAVSKWERNLSCPDINSIPKLSEILGIPVDELLSIKKNDSKRENSEEIVRLILKAVPLAMGVAVVVSSILHEIDSQSAIVMLGIGLTCLSVCLLHEKAG